MILQANERGFKGGSDEGESVSTSLLVIADVRSLLSHVNNATWTYQSTLVHALIN